MRDPVQAGTPTPPGLRGLQRGTLGLCALLYLGVVTLGGPDLVFALALETSPLAWCQTGLLIACATAAALLASLGAAARQSAVADAGTSTGVPASGPPVAPPSTQSWAWALLALALLAAALDDRFMGHERVQAWIVHRWGDELARLAQCLLLLYIPPAVAGLVWLRRTLHPHSWRGCRAAGVVGGLALLLDAAFTSPVPGVLEETLEYTAEALMLTALLGEVRIRACPHR